MVSKEQNFNTAVNTLQSMLLDFKMGKLGKKDVAYNTQAFGEYLINQLEDKK